MAVSGELSVSSFSSKCCVLDRVQPIFNLYSSTIRRTVWMCYLTCCAGLRSFVKLLGGSSAFLLGSCSLELFLRILKTDILANATGVAEIGIDSRSSLAVTLDLDQDVGFVGGGEEKDFSSALVLP